MKKNARWVTLLNYFMFGIFLLAAIVQYNDADVAAWMLAYGIAAAACLLWQWTAIPQALYAVIGGACLLWGAYLLISDGHQLSMEGVFSSIQMKNESIEVIREVGGLFIIAVWMTVLTFYNPSSTK